MSQAARLLLVGSIYVLAGSGAYCDSFQDEIARITRSARGDVGAAARVLETGEGAAYRADGPHPMQSVYKLPIVMAALRDVDRGRLKLDQAVKVRPGDMMPAAVHSPLRDSNPGGGGVKLRELVRLAIVESDGTASDVLLRLAGGPGAVNAYVRGLGVRGMTVAASEAEMAREERVQYRNHCSANAAIALLAALHRGGGLKHGSRDLVLGLLAESVPGARRIKGRLPPGTVVAHKTGTSATLNGISAATNDIGIITMPSGTHLAVAVFVSGSRAGAAAREDVIARIARAAWDRFASKPAAPRP